MENRRLSRAAEEISTTVDDLVREIENLEKLNSTQISLNEDLQRRVEELENEVYDLNVELKKFTNI